VTLSHWAGTPAFEPKQILHPRSAALRPKVRQAIAGGADVRRLGTLYPFFKCVETNEVAVLSGRCFRRLLRRARAKRPLVDSG
jgi:hypothetical protein